jgi:hypothetical protein
MAVSRRRLRDNMKTGFAEMALVGCELCLSGSEQGPVNAAVNPRTS